MRSTQSLAINGNDGLDVGTFADQARDPELKTLLKRSRLQCGQYTANAIARRNTVGQFEQFSQPILLGFGPTFNGCGTIASDDHTAHRDGDHVRKQVKAIAMMTRIRQYLKVLDD
jgi:hypothetical protein